jgi:hypothetical protein
MGAFLWRKRCLRPGRTSTSPRRLERAPCLGAPDALKIAARHPALHKAAIWRHDQVALALAQADSTCVLRAVQGDQRKLTEFLLQHGADASRKNVVRSP